MSRIQSGTLSRSGFSPKKIGLSGLEQALHRLPAKAYPTPSETIAQHPREIQNINTQRFPFLE